MCHNLKTISWHFSGNVLDPDRVLYKINPKARSNVRTYSKCQKWIIDNNSYLSSSELPPSPTSTTHSCHPAWAIHHHWHSHPVWTIHHHPQLSPSEHTHMLRLGSTSDKLEGRHQVTEWVRNTYLSCQRIWPGLEPEKGLAQWFSSFATATCTDDELQLCLTSMILFFF